MKTKLPLIALFLGAFTAQAQTAAPDVSTEQARKEELAKKLQNPIAALISSRAKGVEPKG